MKTEITRRLTDPKNEVREAQAVNTAPAGWIEVVQVEEMA